MQRRRNDEDHSGASRICGLDRSRAVSRSRGVGPVRSRMPPNASNRPLYRRNRKPDAVYTSPLGRCLETGAAIAAPFRIERLPVDGLSDINYGEWQGLTREEAKERWPEEVALWFSAPHLAVIPGGETLAAVLSRTTAALRDILGSHSEGTVVVVGHDSVNRVLLLHAMELPLSRYWHLRQDPCASTSFSSITGPSSLPVSTRRSTSSNCRCRPPIRSGSRANRPGRPRLSPLSQNQRRTPLRNRCTDPG
jgi:broad specificity phosphatase PhoE